MAKVLFTAVGGINREIEHTEILQGTGTGAKAGALTSEASNGKASTPAAANTSSCQHQQLPTALCRLKSQFLWTEALKIDPQLKKVLRTLYNFVVSEEYFYTRSF